MQGKTDNVEQSATSAAEFESTIAKLNITESLNVTPTVAKNEKQAQEVAVNIAAEVPTQIEADAKTPVIIENTNKQDPKSIEGTSNKADTTDATAINLAIPTDNVLEMLALNPQIADLTNNSNSNTNIANSNIDINGVDPAQITQSAQSTKSQSILGNVSVNIPKALNNNLQSAQMTNVKAQTNQLSPDLLNLNIEQQNNTSQIQQAAQAVNIAETDIETPVIEVRTDMMASDANINKNDLNTSQDAKAILNKTALTQDALDKLNAKVVNVENANSNSNPNVNLNLNQNQNQNSNSNSTHQQNKQNTQDQMVKLSIEDNSSAQVDTRNVSTITASVDLSSISNTAGQTSFAKTLDGVQAQASAQPQSQVSKPLSDTEIMSQVNNKLNSFKDEGTTKVNIVLRPENLGKVNLELVNTKEGLTAQMTTDNPQVKEILDKSLNSLKDNLSSQGVNVSSVSVKVEETHKQSNNDMFSFNDGQANAGNQDSSNNAQGRNQNPSQNQKEFSLDEGIDNVMATTNGETEITAENEELSSVGSYTGKVDYKV